MVGHKTYLPDTDTTHIHTYTRTHTHTLTATQLQLPVVGWMTRWVETAAPTGGRGSGRAGDERRGMGQAGRAQCNSNKPHTVSNIYQSHASIRRRLQSCLIQQTNGGVACQGSRQQGKEEWDEEGSPKARAAMKLSRSKVRIETREHNFVYNMQRIKFTFHLWSADPAVHFIRLECVPRIPKVDREFMVRH